MTTGSETWTWGRARVLALLAAAAVVVVAVVAGLATMGYSAVRPDVPVGIPPASGGGMPGRTPSVPATADVTAAPPGAEETMARRDALAAAPMLEVGPDAAQPAVLSTRDPGHLDLPAPTRTGEVGVPSGFAHTPAGALAQLTALDQQVLARADLDFARQVITVWALPGGPTPASWSALKALAAFHSAAGTAGSASSAVAVRATPLAGQVKATDGPDWVVACVLFEVDATLARTARVAVADCQRMAWTPPGVWRIAGGAEPATAPSTWPGTDLAARAGWKTIRYEDPQR